MKNELQFWMLPELIGMLDKKYEQMFKGAYTRLYHKYVQYEGKEQADKWLNDMNHNMFDPLGKIYLTRQALIEMRDRLSLEALETMQQENKSELEYE